MGAPIEEIRRERAMRLLEKLLSNPSLGNLEAQRVGQMFRDLLIAMEGYTTYQHEESFEALQGKVAARVRTGS